MEILADMVLISTEPTPDVGNVTVCSECEEPTDSVEWVGLYMAPLCDRCFQAEEREHCELFYSAGW